jgi:hypothetical protein
MKPDPETRVLQASIYRFGLSEVPRRVTDEAIVSHRHPVSGSRHWSLENGSIVS